MNHYDSRISHRRLGMGPRKYNEDDRKQKIPVSLGKPSLRLRLEAYYKRIAPDQIQGDDWRERFNQIYAKFGGTEQGELKLSLRLRKKYGDAIQLEIVKNAGEGKKASIDQHPNPDETKDETWYQIPPEATGSGDVNFTSNNFDPVAALKMDENEMGSRNAIIKTSPVLERVDLCKSLLPKSDPLYRPSRKRPRKPQPPPDNTKKIKDLGSFAAIARQHETGPMSILYEAILNKHRVRVVTRYVNCIRGTLTGSLIAFDKHCNLILRNVTEVYSKRILNEDHDLSNLEMEVQRRLQGQSETPDERNSVDQWSCRRRHLDQIMVRGDTVVSIYLSKNELSAWPQTSLSPECRYRQQSAKVVAPNERLGTPGAMNLLLDRKQSK